jgi:tetratricopeptide (TPR) repeat protein
MRESRVCLRMIGNCHITVVRLKLIILPVLLITAICRGGEEPSPVFRFWYDESGENWVEGQLVGMGEDWFIVNDRRGERHDFDLPGRSKCDRELVASCRALQRSASLFRFSNFPGAKDELERVRNTLILNGTSVEWARATAGTMPRGERAMQLAWERIGKGLAGTDSRFRWIALNGLEYEIYSVIVALDASGLERIVIKDHQGRQQLVSTNDFQKVTLLPRLWDQATYVAGKSQGATVPWAQRRGPAVRVADRVGVEELIWAEVPSEHGTRQLWTQVPIVEAYQLVAAATKASRESVKLARPYHRRRHERNGDAHCLAGDYLAAVEEYTSALAIEPSDGRNLLRRGFALMQLGDFTAADADFVGALAHADQTHVKFAITECQARISSLRALAEQNDEQALGYHQTSILFAQNIKDVSYLATAEQVPIPIVESLRQFQQREGNIGLLENITSVAKRDMKRRADVWLVESVRLLGSGKAEDAGNYAVRAMRLALGQNSIVAPAREIKARSLDRLAQATVQVDSAAKLYHSGFTIARDAEKEDVAYWRSSEINSSVRRALAEWRSVGGGESLERQLRVSAVQDFVRRAEARCLVLDDQVSGAEQACDMQAEVRDEWKSPDYLKAIDGFNAIVGRQDNISKVVYETESILTTAKEFAGDVSATPEVDSLVERTARYGQRNIVLSTTIERSLAKVEDRYSGFLMRTGELTRAMAYGARSILRSAASRP